MFSDLSLSCCKRTSLKLVERNLKYIFYDLYLNPR